MHTCPHCHAETLSGLAVRWSGRSYAARCPGCGKLSHVLGSTSSGIFSVCTVLLCCAITAALLTESYLVGVAGLGLVIAYNCWAWKRVALFPISPESAKTAERVSWGLVLGCVIAKVFSS